MISYGQQVDRSFAAASECGASCVGYAKTWLFARPVMIDNNNNNNNNKNNHDADDFCKLSRSA